MSGLAYNRALHTDDYAILAPHVERLNAFENKLSGTFYRKDHHHRTWEYANVAYQLETLGISLGARILDTGSGGSFLPPFLVSDLGYRNVVVSDSMHYGDITDMVYQQCIKLGIELPIRTCPVEALGAKDEEFDVTMCISVIEHVAPESFGKALNELVRVTKIGGYIFMTSDYFQSLEQAEKSPFRQIQHNLFYPEEAAILPDLMNGVRFVGAKPDFSYRGDFVNNYSFVNFCLLRVS